MSLSRGSQPAGTTGRAGGHFPRAALFFLSLMMSLTVAAREAVPLAADPALEARVMQVAEELRCLVCQNETLAASQADLAVDLRAQIRERLQRGESPAAITDFMVARYGEFVRYRPALSATTALLWGGPFVLLALAAGVLVATLRRRGPAPVGDLSESERQRVRELRLGAGVAP